MSERYASKTEELTYDERATWGTCLQCGAEPGKWCDGTGSPQLGVTLDGSPIHHGVHMGRLQAAPTKRIVSFA